MRYRWILMLPALGIALAILPGHAGEPKGNAKDKEAIAKCAAAFLDAFHKGDAKALAAFWTPNGEFIDQTGKHIKGRKALEKAFTTLFAEHKDLKARIDSHTLNFVTPNVAIEEGTTEVFAPDGKPPTKVNYTMVHVKKEGEWLIARLRNSPFVPPSNYPHLRGLEWAIGDWAGKTETGEMEHLSLSWAEGQNFIVAKFSTTVRDVSVGSSKALIGWDPVSKRIRSWFFDATGGFGEGAWSGSGQKWTIKIANTLPDGKKAATTITLGQADADTISLQAKDRSVDDIKLPDTKAVKLKRTK
jgi:uncharacterized protein (TIGR02246 family)